MLKLRMKTEENRKESFSAPFPFCRETMKVQNIVQNRQVETSDQGGYWQLH